MTGHHRSTQDVAQARAVQRREADHAAFTASPLPEEHRGGGVASLDARAKRLDARAKRSNEPGRETPPEGSWTATAVTRVLAWVA